MQTQPNLHHRDTAGVPPKPSGDNNMVLVNNNRFQGDESTPSGPPELAAATVADAVLNDYRQPNFRAAER